MNELKLFSNPKFGQLRTVAVGDKIYFVASDVAKSLGYAKPQNAISAHCKGALKWSIPTNGGNQEMNIIPEGDIYRLAAKSELPAADEFESWIFDEVLPSIRKNGFYGRQLTRKEEVKLYLEALEEQDAKIDAVQKDLQDLKNDLPLLGVECDRIVTAVKRRGVDCLGGKKSAAYQDRSIRNKVYSDIYRQLKREFAISSYKAIKRNQTEFAVSIINEYRPPFALNEEIEECNHQVGM